MRFEGMGIEGFAYEQVISLGAFCQVAEQIRRLDLPTAHSPFDWLVTPLWSLGQILDDQGFRFVQRCVVGHDPTSPRCHEYGVLYHHEFHRDCDGKVVFDPDDFSRARSKLLHKMERFDDACKSGKRTLFIRLAGHVSKVVAQPYVEDEIPLTSEDIRLVVGRLHDRYPTLPFDVLFVTVEGATVLDLSGGIPKQAMVAQLPKITEAWEGDDASWRKLLEGVAEGPRAYPVLAVDNPPKAFAGEPHHCAALAG